MQELMKKIDMALFMAKFKMQCRLQELESEEGDTNFLSIIIILAIVLIVAVIFISFKDKIVEVANNSFNDFSDKFNGQTTDVTL